MKIILLTSWMQTLISHIVSVRVPPLTSMWLHSDRPALIKELCKTVWRLGVVIISQSFLAVSEPHLNKNRDGSFSFWHMNNPVHIQTRCHYAEPPGLRMMQRRHRIHLFNHKIRLLYMIFSTWRCLSYTQVLYSSPHFNWIIGLS